MSDSLRARLGSAALLLPLVVAFVWLGSWPLAILLGLIAILAGWELGALLAGLGVPAPKLVPFLALAAFAGALALGPALGLDLLTALLWVSALGWLYHPGQTQRPVRAPRAWLLRIAGALYLGLFLACLARLTAGPWPGALPLGARSTGALYALALVWSCDSGAYITGHLAGRHRLWPAVSPAKTWEGALGGAVASVLAALVLADLLSPGLRAVPAAGLGLAVGTAAQLGDLIESRLKRMVGVKDTGRLIPGHGGILDRVDSVLFAAPVVFYGLKLLLRP